MNPSTVLLLIKAIDLLAMGLEHGISIKDEIDRTTALIRKMVEEGRDPTPEEWADLDSRTDAVMARITG